jgi:hypothetical protein
LQVFLKEPGQLGERNQVDAIVQIDMACTVRHIGA